MVGTEAQPAKHAVVSSTKPPRIKNLDGVRGLGTLLVMAHHLRLGVPNAWVAIGLFFSLSGLLMTTIALGAFAKKGEFSAVVFWNRRVLRLLPGILLLVAIIALVTVAQRTGLIGTPPTSEEQWFLCTDLIWALLCGENFNLIWRDNDYFADFQRASIMRHVWSLAIEEQCYLVWPGIFIVLSTMANSLQPKGAPAVDIEPHLVSPRVRTVAKILVCFELLAIALSQWIGKHTCETQGPSAAYYLSWTRAGDFAVGGLVACTVFLLPQDTFARHTQAPNLPKMSFQFRVLLECGSAGLVLGMILGPMIQTPQDELLEDYFSWFRFPHALFVLFCAIPQTLQSSEPLPRWAIFTRWMCNPVIVFLGVTSCGLYLVHWVLIVWFGDSELNTVHSETTLHGRQEGYSALIRDVAIGVVSIAVSTASFFLFEVPVMKFGAKHPPGRVISTGLASTFSVAVLVLAATSGREDPSRQDNRVALLCTEAKTNPASVPKMLFLGDSQSMRLADLFADNVANPKWTPRCRHANRSLWGPKVVSGGHGGHGAIQFFEPADRCPRCHNYTYEPLSGRPPCRNVAALERASQRLVPEMMRTIATEQAQYVFVIDSHWFSVWPEKPGVEGCHKKGPQRVGRFGTAPSLLSGLKNMLKHLRHNGARHVFLSTSSPFPFGRAPQENVSWSNFSIDGGRLSHSPGIQRPRFLEVMNELRRCSEPSATVKRLLVTLVDYHKLICPEFDSLPKFSPPTTKEVSQEEMRQSPMFENGNDADAGPDDQCKHHQHGFSNRVYMPDGRHLLSNRAGHWTVSQLGNIVKMAVVASEGAGAALTFTAPYKCLNTEFPPDQSPSELQKLFKTIEVCLPSG